MTPVQTSDKQRSFCTRLKTERERRGTSLATIAASTKIKASLLDALERGDLSHWPKGIYRRAFFREYVAAVGLPLEPTVSDLTELFTDGERPRSLPPVDADPDALRLFFAPQTTAPAVRTSRDMAERVAAAAVEVVVVLAVARLVSAIAPWGTVPVALTLGVLCYLAASGLGVRPASWLWTQIKGRHSSKTAAPLVLSFEPGSTVASGMFDRVLGTIRIGQALLLDYAERISAFELTASGRRRRDLASLRRQRPEATERTADEVIV
jgi:transcriptional regulator with XRE-family HTH domain